MIVVSSKGMEFLASLRKEGILMELFIRPTIWCSSPSSQLHPELRAEPVPCPQCSRPSAVPPPFCALTPKCIWLNNSIDPIVVPIKKRFTRCSPEWRMRQMADCGSALCVAAPNGAAPWSAGLGQVCHTSDCASATRGRRHGNIVAPGLVNNDFCKHREQHHLCADQIALSQVLAHGQLIFDGFAP